MEGESLGHSTVGDDKLFKAEIEKLYHQYLVNLVSGGYLTQKFTDDLNK